MTDSRADFGKTILNIKFLFIAFWPSMFLMNQYAAIYLRGFAFMTDLSVGIVMSVCFLLTTVAQITFGNIADRARTKNRVLMIALTGFTAGLIFLAVPNHTSFATLLPSVFLFYIFFVIPALLVDTIVVENAPKMGVSFGSMRVFASVGIFLASLVIFLLGLFMEVSIHIVLTVVITAALLSFIPARLLPRTEGHAYRAKESGAKSGKSPLTEILKNRKLMLLLCFILLLFIGTQATNIFLGVYLSAGDGLGAGLSMLGLFFVIGVGSEVLLMLYGNRHFQAMNIYNVLLLVSIAALVRSLIFFFAPGVFVFMLGAVAQAFMLAPLFCRLSKSWTYKRIL